jgi:hypothetical protein
MWGRLNGETPLLQQRSDFTGRRLDFHDDFAKELVAIRRWSDVRNRRCRLIDAVADARGNELRRLAR